jgi:DNA-binding beta-propeller fold protein YncE
MIKGIYHKDVYDKMTNKVIVTDIGSDDNKAIQIFNLNNIKYVSFKKVQKVNDKVDDKYMLKIIDKDNKEVYAAEDKNRNSILNDYNKILGLLTDETKNE